jgi:hypothetical protein
MFMMFNTLKTEEMTPQRMAKWDAFYERAEKVATPISSNRLRSPETARVVSVRDGKTILTDGPFVETKEFLGGYAIIDCPSLEVALELASLMPTAPEGYIEVRPINDAEIR